MRVDYTGQLPGGSAISGAIEVESLDEAQRRLEQMGVRVMSVSQAHAPRPRRQLAREDFLFFNEQLASLARTDMALEPGLRMLARDVKSERLRQVIDELVADLSRGVPVDQAIAARGAAFPPLYANLIRAGVESGQLASTLFNLNSHFELAARTRRLVWEAAGYPVVVAAVALAVLSFFLCFVAPKFREIYADFGIHLPALTLAFLWGGERWPMFLAAFGAVIVGVFLLWKMLNLTARGVRIREAVVSRIPLIGQTFACSLIARFSRCAAVLADAGHPLPNILRLAAESTASPLLIRDAELCASAIERGEPAIAATARTRLIPACFAFTSDASREADRLPAALHEIAETYSDLAEHRLMILRTVLVPLFTLVVGALIGLGIVAIFLPLLTLINALTG
ncbi:MAG: type II secretion system F family protein [Phycisphaerae bacterium]|nr:type II secretion system F family protein [Phycisphaerae bacterium]